MFTQGSTISDKEIILVPTGFLIPSEDYYSFGATIDAMKCFQILVKHQGLMGISLQLDQKIQTLLDKAYLEKEPLPLTCEDEPLLNERDGEYVLNGRKDMGFLYLLITYGIKKDIPCFASDNFCLLPEERAQFAVSQLLKLYDKYGNIAHVCSKTQAERIEEYFNLQIC